MANTRLRIQKDLEQSQSASSVIVTDSNKEAAYLPIGTNGQVLSVVSGVAQWANNVATAAFNLTDGTNTQVINSGDSMLVQAGSGMSVLVGATDRVSYAVRLSADANNIAQFGTDGGVFVTRQNLVTNATYSDTTNSITITFSNGSTIVVPIVDDIGQFLANYTISDGTNTGLINNHGTVTFTGSNKITTTVSGSTVNIKIDTSGATAGQVLTSTGAGAAPTWQNPAVQNPSPIPRTDEFAPVSGSLTVTLSQAPTSVTGYNKVDVYRNGKLLQSSDYTITGGTTVNFVTAFGTSAGAVYGETVIVKYHI